ncbi:MAG: hypothetical protein JXA52_01865 [Planctomycetes bacterium]|nr:hypothetical protein [Planctomycetota bacterium]
MFLCLPQCYIGPGIGGGVFAIIIGFILSIFLALFAIIWYPLRRLFKKKKPQVTKPKQEELNKDTTESI